MNRRTFAKSVAGLIAGGIGMLFTRQAAGDHVPGVMKVEDPDRWKSAVRSSPTKEELIELMRRAHDKLVMRPAIWAAGDWGVPCPNCSDINVVRSCKQHHILKCCDCGLMWDEAELGGRVWNIQQNIWQNSGEGIRHFVRTKA